ncbi:MULTISPECIES: DUF6542 domain-containing protein [Streptomycetaceae]|uniref:DUF6542 domain-containing protein n=1 Tax=Streptomycetaceae TaxID=2062 RepID=UPI000213FF74|nr:DUF6542 domain-containing protein [Streptantibioticus cattleyicolor]MYS60794.1 hypothetical protein [Streptomyces sp. SID5468]CCB76615.1 conserved membrane protein of unknown function [Streptantibioticus cattleyicolor NRRL 8057 = DSM 46488]
MDQPRTRTPNTSRAPGGRPRLPRPAVARGRQGNRPATTPAPRTAEEERATVYGTRRRTPLPRAAVAALARAARPKARLTGFGTGVLITALTLLGGAADALLSDGPGIFCGLLFTTASLLGALWVRPADLAAAPVSAPIAFALTLAVTGPGAGEGVLGHLMGMVTSLATHTGWLYTGTLLAAAVTATRKLLPARGGPAR